ncbi:MAG: hypothetical protein ABSC72_04165 [Methylovirgula sp.]
MRTMPLRTGSIIAALWLAGCNQPSPVASVPPPPPQAAQEPAAFANLPPAAPCSDKIHRYQTVLRADQRTGNVEPPVYQTIEQELSEAAQACAAGHDGKAMALIQASEERHGYHV